MLRALVPVVALALSVSGASAEEFESVAARFTGLAEKSDADGMASLFHYPPSYSDAERREDQSAVAKSLRWLLANLGAPQDSRPRSSAAEFYEVGVFGGDNAYWASISPVHEVQLLYDTTFAKAGPGYLKILVFRPQTGSAPEIHAAAFGIPVAVPDAKQRAINLMLGLFEHKGMQVPPDIREALEQQLQPSHASPGG